MHQSRTHFGAVPVDGGVEITLWAPGARRVDVEVVRASGRTLVEPLTSADGELWRAVVGEAAAGDTYRLRRDTNPYWPDPASRSQPAGVHGPSAIVDPSSFAWTDERWAGPAPDDLVIYELHTGAFTPEGTFDGVRERLPYLRDLGVTAIELMPIAAFPGRWNWGYDGAALFAPAHQYGGPDGLRRLVDAAHGLGLAVLLDVVYNHLGPDGAYLAAFAPVVLRRDRDSPWGGALDVDRGSGARLREFFIDNACHWIGEYHIDGLRLDATHAIVEHERPTFVAELTAAVRAAAGPRRVVVIAEDERNLAEIVRPVADGGWGLDGVWADDFHHHVHRHLTGEHDGYFADFSGSTGDIATTVRDGWFYRGQIAPHTGRARGTDPGGLALRQFVFCLQNHDQIGNRAFGERLHQLTDPDQVAAATVLLLLVPETPLLFMGQEWAASSPFQYFTDHAEPLGSQVVEGRRREFQAFTAFGGPEAASRIPSPQAPGTFERSRLRWEETEKPPHAGWLALHRSLLRLRASMASQAIGLSSVEAIDDESLVLRHGEAGGQPSYVTLVAFGPGTRSIDLAGASDWRTVLMTGEDDNGRPSVTVEGARATIALPRPGAVVLAIGATAGRP